MCADGCVDGGGHERPIHMPQVLVEEHLHSAVEVAAHSRAVRVQAALPFKVPHRRPGVVHDAPARALGAPAKVDVLAVHEVRLVKAAQRVEQPPPRKQE